MIETNCKRERERERERKRESGASVLTMRLNADDILLILVTESQLSTVCLSYLPTPPLGQDMTQGQSLSGV